MTRLPHFGLGCAALPYDQNAESDAAAGDVIRFALEAGVQWLDTSSLYSGGANEAGVGTALAGIPRDTYSLSTRTGYVMHDEARAVDVKAGGADDTVLDYSYDFTMWSVERSLQRLQTNRLDMVLLHAVKLQHIRQAVDDGYRALSGLRDQGVIGAIGAGMTTVDASLKLVQRCDLDCLMLACHWHLLDQTAAEALLPLCLDKGVPVVAAGPFASGVLADPERDDVRYNYAPAAADVRARARAMADVCAQHGVTLKAAAIQFPLRHPAVHGVMSGPRTVAEVEENLTLLDVEISEALWESLCCGM